MATTTLRRPQAVAPPDRRAFASGARLLDLANGGGWALNRVINLVGDRSTNKTGLAIEACANFAKLYGAENIRYNEPEFAFDPEYASTLGMPSGVSFVGDEHVGGSPTVEHWADDMEQWLSTRTEKSPPSLYVLDSLDALGDEAEMDSDEWAKGWNTRKPRIISEFFRSNIQRLAERHCTLFIVSQIRENIGVTFGEKYSRSGGKALDFYASQIVWLAYVGRITHKVAGNEQTVGIRVRAQNKKNKMGPPFKQVELHLLFNYGIDDELSMLAWLKADKGADLSSLSVPADRYATAVVKAREKGDTAALADYAIELRQLTTARWAEIEAANKVGVKKYD